MKRRDFLTLSVKAAMAAGYTAAIPASLLRTHTAHAAVAAAGLSDPAMQPLFINPVPNALAAAFKYVPNKNRLSIITAQTTQYTGLVAIMGNNGKKRRVATTVWGYGVDDGIGVTWPGRTIERHVNDEPLEIRWENNLVGRNGKPLPHLLPVDESLHWTYSLHGQGSINGVDYRQYSIAEDGVPLVPHVHGGRNDPQFDGNPEYFFSPDGDVKGPRYVTNRYMYGGPDWNDTAGMMWYHDHALGITRLNVYAGLAGFFPLRDDNDTGKPGNPAGLPADPYELGYAVQDRMFRSNGELFYSAFPGDPFYDDFITGEGVILPDVDFPGGGPTALAEFFGDHMLVNGIIWPKASVESRQYRVRFLNGTDSRFMRLKLKVIAGGASNPGAVDPAAGYPLPFYVVGSDQGLRYNAQELTEVDFMPGERLDLVIDFKSVPFGSRVIVENLLGDAPFGGDLPAAEDLFPDRRTDRVMAFDVESALDNNVPDTAIGSGSVLGGGVGITAQVDRTRKLALFEGSDSIGRLQPLLGTAEPVTDVTGAMVEGTMTFSDPITENPAVGDTEIWEIYNATGDAHPVHVHLVHFEVMNREGIKWDSATTEEDRVLDPATATPAGDGAYLVSQPVAQHDGTVGNGFKLVAAATDGIVQATYTSEQTRRDMVMALPGEVTRIKMTFDKPGRYVWHCHILSHEDHEMMRPFHVGPGPF
jgi:FtsP/CotA-like multicopper oxidase with cupredoxin domain